MQYIRFLILYIIFLGATHLSFAQRPMSRDFIASRLDSIRQEANVLYAHRSIQAESELRLRTSIDDKNYIIYDKHDTLIFVLVDQNGQQINQAYYIEGKFSEPIKEEVNLQVLELKEQLLLIAKRKLIYEINDLKYGIDTLKNAVLKTVFFSTNQGYKLYLFTDLLKDNVINFRNSFLFVSDQLATILSYTKFHERANPTKLIDKNGRPIVMLSFSNPKKAPFIFASDISIFRVSDRPLGLNEFKVYCERNKAIFKYNAKSNSLSLE